MEGEASKEVAVASGVPQGTVLGPLLFLCHVNDLSDTVKSTVRLFEDACLLYREVRWGCASTRRSAASLHQTQIALLL